MDEYKGYGYITALKKVPGHVQAELFYYAPGGEAHGRRRHLLQDGPGAD